MLLAELEVFHSRPIAPTRRVALGVTVLPADPPPGFGGLLLAGIVATFVDQIDPDLYDDLLRLTHQVEAGQRIPQPRLRHRLQEDRIGLNGCRHRLVGTGDALRFDIDAAGSPEPNVLGAVYAAGRLPADQRPEVLRTVRRALSWRGEVGPDLVHGWMYHGNLAARLASMGPGARPPVVWPGPPLRPNT